MKRAAAALLAAALLITPAATAQLATRAATFTWDKALLRGTFSYRDAIDDKIKKRLGQGLAVTIVMRGYVYNKADNKTPVALTANTCRVAYDLWNDVFAVVVNGVTKKAVVNLNGVHRLCTDMDKLPIVERKAIKGSGADYYLAVKVEVNPVSPKLLKDIQTWVTRPLGVSGTIGTGDALFATFVSVFMQKSVASADKVVEFQTGYFPP